MNPLVTVDAVSKRFKLYDRKWHHLIELLSFGSLRKFQEKWVLRDVSFSVGIGESIAIVGENGSGKSTLLSIIVGARAATQGEVQTNGKVSALLELGMGFHPDFTGRENAVMGLQILGISNEQIMTLIDPVADFAELGEYFDRPLRTYSSGMQVRLAFSVATVVEPQLLIVDEALSVGDTYFQHKSMGRIRALRENGTSLLFVSHDAGAVKSLCDRALLLDNGVIIKDGPPDLVMDFYNAMIAEREKSWEIQQLEGQTRSGSKEITFDWVKVFDQQNDERETLRVGEKVSIRCRFRPHVAMPFPTIGISIRDRLGNEVFGTNTYHLSLGEKPLLDGSCELDFETVLRLGVGSYSITVAAHTQDTHLSQNFDWWDNACVFQVIPGQEYTFHGTTFLDVNVRVNDIDSR